MLKRERETHLRIREASAKEAEAMLKIWGEASKKMLQIVRKESKKKFKVRVLLHPELAYFEALSESVTRP